MTITIHLKGALALLGQVQIAHRWVLTFASSVMLLISSNALHANECENVLPKRVVSVGGSITETIYALGKGHWVVGSDTTSYYPEQAKLTPKVGYQRALSTEGILALRPDLLILSDQAGPKSVVEQLQNSGLDIAMLETPNSLDGIKSNVAALGALLCAKQASETLREQIEKQARKLHQASSDSLTKPRVLFIMQHGGGAPMVSGTGTSADAIIELSGATNVVSDFEGYKPLSPESLISTAPDFILTTSMGLTQAGGIDSMLALPGLSLTPAGKHKKVIAMDGLLLLGFGPRTAEAAHALRSSFSKDW